LSDLVSTITTVIPAFNAARTVSAALDSVLAQTSPPDAIIVVDDGSTDDTPSIVQGYAPDVQLVRQANHGAAVARQVGTERATTTYVAYLDADDWWLPEALMRLREATASQDVAFLLADLQRARPGAPAESYLPRNSEFFPYLRQCLARDAAQLTPTLYRLGAHSAVELLLRGYPVFPSTMFVRREAVAAVGGWDARFRRCQDFDLGLRLARHYGMHYLDEVQAILGLHDVNADADAYVLKQTQGDIRVLLAHFEAEPAGSPYRRAVARAVARKYCGLGYVNRRVDRWDEARAAYRAALAWPGRRVHAALRWCWLGTRPWRGRQSDAAVK
jgi:glycosyltransferase involved in cell wall biosynthesis